MQAACINIKIVIDNYSVKCATSNPLSVCFDTHLLIIKHAYMLNCDSLTVRHSEHLLMHLGILTAFTAIKFTISIDFVPSPQGTYADLTFWCY